MSIRRLAYASETKPVAELLFSLAKLYPEVIESFSAARSFGWQSNRSPTVEQDYPQAFCNASPIDQLR
jgi:hypothetical protein